MGYLHKRCLILAALLPFFADSLVLADKPPRRSGPAPVLVFPDESGSHKLLDTPKIDPADLLRRFLDAEQKRTKDDERSNLLDKLKKFKNNPDQAPNFEELTKLLRNNPELRKTLEKWLEENGRRLPGDLANQMRWFLRATGPIEVPPIDPADLPTVLPPAPPLDPEELRSRERFGRWLEQQTKNWSRVNGPLRDSPAFDLARRDLEEYVKNFRNLPRLNNTGLDGQLDRLGVKSWPDRLMSDLNVTMPKLDWAKMPKVKMPRLNVPSWKGPPSIQVPNVGGPPAIGAGDGRSMLWLAALGVFVVVAWRLARLYRPKLLVTLAERVYRPLPPERVTTREEMIRAFEHLALARLGEPARTWNHLEVAGELGGDDSERRRLAQELASCYEQARYTPASDPLPDERLAEARRALTVLSGGAAV